MWLTLLLRYKNAIGLGLIALAVLGYVGVLKYQIHSRDSQIVTLNATLAAERAFLLETKAQTVLLQSKLDAITEVMEQKKRNADYWRKNYENSAKRWQEVVGGLGSWNPGADETECAAAKRLLKEYRK